MRFNSCLRGVLLLLLVTPMGCESLFQGISVVPPEETLRPPLITNPNDRVAEAPPDGNTVIPLVTGATRSSTCISVIGGEVSPHFHKHSDETVYLIRGKGDLLLNDRWQHIEAGAVVYVPLGVRHAFISKGDEPAVVLSTYTPPFIPGDRVPVPVEKKDG